MEKTKLSKRLRAWRARAKRFMKCESISQGDLASLLGISRQYLNRALNDSDTTVSPSLERCLQWLEYVPSSVTAAEVSDWRAFG